MRPGAGCAGLALVLLLAPRCDAARRKGGPIRGDCGGMSAPAGPEWAEWSRLVQAGVRRAWVIPVEAKHGMPGIAIVRAHVTTEGVVDDVAIVRSKGDEDLAGAARAALVNASPLPPLPPHEPDEEGKTGVFINYLFNYNVSAKESCRFRDRWMP